MQRLKQSDPRAAFRRIYFTCVDAAALTTRLQASDMSATFVVYLSKNGGAPANVAAPTVVEVGAANAKGLFYVELSAANLDTPGMAVLVITNTGGTKTMEKREQPFEIEDAEFGTAATGALGASSFTTSLTAADSFHKDKLVKFRTGALTGQVKKVGAYANSQGRITLATVGGAQLAFTAAPANGDVFELLSE